MLIGAKGEGIKQVRDKFADVNIVFPDQGKKSEVVTLRGPKTDVDKCYVFLQKRVQDLVSSEKNMLFTPKLLKWTLRSLKFNECIISIKDAV